MHSKKGRLRHGCIINSTLGDAYGDNLAAERFLGQVDVELPKPLPAKSGNKLKFIESFRPPFEA
jgi:hypothetical protein